MGNLRNTQLVQRETLCKTQCLEPWILAYWQWHNLPSFTSYWIVLIKRDKQIFFQDELLNNSFSMEDPFYILPIILKLILNLLKEALRISPLSNRNKSWCIQCTLIYLQISLTFTGQRIKLCGFLMSNYSSGCSFFIFMVSDFIPVALSMPDDVQLECKIRLWGVRKELVVGDERTNQRGTEEKQIKDWTRQRRIELVKIGQNLGNVRDLPQVIFPFLESLILYMFVYPTIFG